MSPVPGQEALDVSWDFEWWNTGSFEARGFFSHLQAGWAKVEHRAHVGLLHLPGRSVLFDVGYAPRFHDCAAPRLASIYRWATPTTIPAGSSVRERLAGRKVDQLLLSHWHADHTGGLLDIPEASVWRPLSSHEAVRQEALSAWAPLKGILAGQLGLEQGAVMTEGVTGKIDRRQRSVAEDITATNVQFGEKWPALHG